MKKVVQGNMLPYWRLSETSKFPAKNQRRFALTDCVELSVINPVAFVKSWLTQLGVTA